MNIVVNHFNLEFNSFDKTSLIVFLIFLLIICFNLLFGIISFNLDNSRFNISYKILEKKNFIGMAFVNGGLNNLFVFTILTTIILFFQHLIYTKRIVLFNFGSETVFNMKIYFTQLIISAIIFITLFIIYYLFSSLVRVDYFFLLVLLFTFSTYVFMCNDLVGLMLSIEGVSFILYLFASMPFGNSYKYLIVSRIRSASKYIIFGLFSSSLLLFGLTLVYGITGLIKLTDIELFFKYYLSGVYHNNGLLLVGVFLIFSGVLFKLAIVPFHMWLIDVYLNAEDLTVFFFAIFTKTFFILLLFFKFSFLIYFWEIKQIAYFFGCLSIIVGTFGAFSQSNLIGLIAYSSIVNIGYIVILISSIYSTSQSISILYMILYSFTNFVLFYYIFNCRRSYLNNDFVTEMNKYRALFGISFEVAIGLGLILFALMGLPPFVNFFLKFYLFSIIFYYFSYTTTLFIIFFSVLTLFYYLKMIRNSFFYDYLIDSKSNIWVSGESLKTQLGSFFIVVLLCATPTVPIFLNFIDLVLSI